MVGSSIAPDESSAAALQWATCELCFASDVPYPNPLYAIDFYAEMISPAGETIKVNGFWDGSQDWKIRFMPDQTGLWSYRTFCSDTTNTGLHDKAGTFRCEANPGTLDLYRRGAIIHRKGDHHLKHADGTPFLWIACTAWNGTLKSTGQEWDTYLDHRARHHYSVIQLVATPWRGCDVDSQLQVAYTGTHSIQINPAFFRHVDRKIDLINAYGLVAAPVLLWAMPFGKGRYLSPGHHLPRQAAIRLARYMVARYGGHHVVWILGGDGYYTGVNERRWKDIGRKVFGGQTAGTNSRAVVAMHPMGRSWIGDAYAHEDWLDLIGYQSGHSHQAASVKFITQGPPARRWPHLPARPMLNMEPCYEEIYHKVDAAQVRKASYWSLLATPVSGITYGANGIWPWIRKGERILNHGTLSEQAPTPWQQSLDLPGSRQIGYLSAFIRRFPWWALFPDEALLAEQPGNQAFDQFISVARTKDYRLILVYVPVPVIVKLYNPKHLSYRVRRFDPAANSCQTVEMDAQGEMLIFEPVATDVVLILEKK